MPTGNPERTIRPLLREDLDAAESILTAAFRRRANRRLDLERGFALNPEAWFLALEGDAPVGVVGAVVYDRFAWIGLMGVSPQRQSRGIGRALMSHLLAALERLGVTMSRLDASAAGRPLYASLGFVEEDEVCAFERPLAEPGETPQFARPGETAAGLRVARVTAADLPALASFDAPLYGADRGALLERLFSEFPERALLVRNASDEIQGYAIAQAQRLGPWLARDETGAEMLLLEALTLPFDGLVQVLVPGKNLAGRSLLARHGFAAAHANLHMRRGDDLLQGHREQVFGQGSFAFG